MGKRNKQKQKRVTPAAPRRPRRAMPTAAGKRNYAASIHDRLTASFTGEYAGVNDVLYQSLPRMRARARELAMDNDYAKNFLRIIQRNVIGPKGIRLQSKARRPDGSLDTVDNASIEAAWQRWGKLGSCTVDGRSSWLDVQRQVMRTLATDGEVLVRLYPGWPGNDFRFAVQVLEADWLDIQLNKRLSEDREIIMGVEIDQHGRPINYYLLPEHPARIMQRTARTRHEVVPARFLRHIYLSDRPGQLRGAPWVHTAVRRLHLLAGYEEAEVVASRAAAQKMGIIKTPTGTEYTGDGGEDKDGAALTHMEAGTMEQIPAGWDYGLLDPTHPTTAFPATVKQLLRGASAGFGVSYNTLAQDLEGVSFSSIRQGVLDDRDEWKQLQTWISEQLPEMVFEMFLPLALLAQQVVGPTGVPLPENRIDKFRAHIWQPRGFQWVAPKDDQEVSERSVAAGFKSEFEVVSEQGRDLEDVYRELAEAQRLREQYGVELAPPKKAPILPPQEMTE